MKFETKIRDELLSLKREHITFFAWLCAVRALPFLGTNGNFSFWKQINRLRFLYSILHAADAAYAYAADAAYADAYADADAAYADAAYAADAYAYAADAAYAYADANADADVANAAYAAYAAADAAYAAATAASAAYTAADAAYAAANAADAAAAADTAAAAADAATAAAAAAAANYAANAAANAAIDESHFKRLIFDDLALIKAGDFEHFDHNLSIYMSEAHGDIWGNLTTALRTEGCGYWADLYNDIFNNGFKIDKEEFIRRLSVPEQIAEDGAADVAAYLDNAKEQGVVYTQRETRLIILGSAGAGKTTLVRRLNGDRSYPDPEESTHGVDTSVELDCNGTKAHVWDFGGQVIYHASHRCFMSANCVYILVINARTEDNRDIGRINYWLDTIRIYSDNKAKVFIIFNESDNRGQNVEDYDFFKNGEYASLVREIYSFNIGKDMDSLNVFKNDLAVFIETAGHQTFGKNDSNALGELKNLFEQGNQILDTYKLEEVLRNSGIQKEKDQKRAKELFNTLGIALSYDFMEGHVLDPYWISHGVYKVIDHLQKNHSKFINYNKLEDVFSDESNTYPEGKKQYILDLMDHHKIGFRNEGGVRGLIVPCAASLFKPKDVNIDTEPDSILTLIEREDRKEFPADFFYKYIYANKNDIENDGEWWAMWQTGMVLAGMQASALVELNENRCINITVWGKGKKDYSEKLELLINGLLQEYRFTSYEYKRPRGGRIIKIITLVFESIAKGWAKAVIETSAGGAVKPS